MKRIKWLTFVSIFLLMSCSPNFNWREFRFFDGDVVFMFPCKPQEFSKDVQLGEENHQLVMAACSVGEFNFTVSRMNTTSKFTHEQIIQMWQRASWYAVNGSVPKEDLIAKNVSVMLLNRKIEAFEINDDKVMHVQWRWFSDRGWIYQMAVYMRKQKKEERISTQVDEMFFDSIR